MLLLEPKIFEEHINYPNNTIMEIGVKSDGFCEEDNVYLSKGYILTPRRSMSSNFKKLNLNSMFLFAAVLEDPEACKIVLEILLGQEITKVNVNYNLEAQNYKELNLPKRCRYYQSELDVASLKPGENYNDLKPSYIIFICIFDPFGKGLYRYTFERTCLENGESLGDEAKIIIFNTRGKDSKNISMEVLHFLEYFENTTDQYVSNLFEKNIINLHKKVCALKKSREWEENYMTLEEVFEVHEQRAMSQGLERGNNAMKEIIVEILSKIGKVPYDLNVKISDEDNIDNLRRWCSIAINSQSIEEFMEKYQE